MKSFKPFLNIVGLKERVKGSANVKFRGVNVKNDKFEQKNS